MPAPPNQYLFRAMWRPNLNVQPIVDISRVLPVYIRHIRGCHHPELSRSVPVIVWRGILQHESVQSLRHVERGQYSLQHHYTPLNPAGIVSGPLRLDKF